jgi:hypothetical protein
MMLFTFLALLLLLVGVCIQIRKKTLIPVVFTGMMCAVLICAFRTFFLFAHRVIPYSFSENFIFLLMRQIILPTFVLYGLFFALSRDSIEFKVEMFLPLTASFYMVYLPFCIVSSAEGLYSAFGLFVKPCMFAAMLCFLSVLAKTFFAAFNSKKIFLLVIYVLLALIYLIVPAMVEAMYLVNTSLMCTLLCAIPYCALPAVICFFKVIKA